MPSSGRALHAALAGFSAVLVGNGLGRFAYTPLLPALISDHWFSPSAAAYLGAANLAGYLAGAVLGHAATRYIRPAWLLRGMMVLTAASLLACAGRDLGFAWFFLWRFASGYAGGVLMVVGAPIVLSATPLRRRGLVGGMIFTGVGLGIAASGIIVPQLIEWGGLQRAWIGLGAVSLVLTLIAWNGWPQQQTGLDATRPARAALGIPASALLAEYGLNAVGLVPHMLFLVDYVARGLGRGLDAGASDWVVFGIAAVFGPVLAGQLADRVGFRAALRLAFCAQAAAVALPVVTSASGWIAVSSAVTGAFVPGISTLVLGRIHELIQDGPAQARAWAHATTAWALAQAIAAYGYSYLFGRTDDYSLLFGIAVAAIMLALGLELVAGRSRPPQGAPRPPR
ncbi:MAG TPA: YbfB/YjiJ family MFS transporter [Xanthobacteraceae bacterium]|nr:YbfB/YjiJ family MFS transporter [Xanthobacteraceae bacterium]